MIRTNALVAAGLSFFCSLRSERSAGRSGRENPAAAGTATALLVCGSIYGGVYHRNWRDARSDDCRVLIDDLSPRRRLTIAWTLHRTDVLLEVTLLWNSIALRLT